jgi:hypothetical protein
MHTENLSEAFSRCLELLDQPAAAPPRAEFAADFAAALQRLEASGGEANGRRVESLQSALGAAAVEQWELALAFVAASKRAAPMAAAPGHRSARASVPLATLRRRFTAVIGQH